jgi:hypothetical protein
MVAAGLLQIEKTVVNVTIRGGGGLVTDGRVVLSSGPGSVPYRTTGDGKPGPTNVDGHSVVD